MLRLIALTLLFVHVLCFKGRINTKRMSTTYSDDYKIPKYVKRIFEKQKMPKRNIPEKKASEIKNIYISEEEANYNALIACKSPFGLLQTKTDF